MKIVPGYEVKVAWKNKGRGNEKYPNNVVFNMQKLFNLSEEDFRED